MVAHDATPAAHESVRAEIKHHDTAQGAKTPGVMATLHHLKLHMGVGAGGSHLSVDIHHMRCLQLHMEVQPQLPTEAVQGTQRAACQQDTARNIGQAPATAHDTTRHSIASKKDLTSM